MRTPGLDRREFLKVTAIAGGGFALSLSLRSPAALGQADAAVPNAAHAFSPSPFIRITSDGVITLVAKNPEAGQGVKTSLPMILAEELEADFGKVVIESGTLDPQLGPQFAGGSLSTPMNFDTLRRAGAVVRAMLLQAAAQAWGVPIGELTAENSVVTHRGSGRQLTYGELAAKAATLALPDEKTIRMKAPGQFRLLGTRVGGVDNRAIVTGQPLFGIDQRKQGMVHAVYAKCPVFGGKVVSANLDQIKAMPGVRDAFVLTGTANYYGLLPGLAITATSTWAAFKALQELRVAWDEGPGGNHSSEGYEAQASALLANSGTEVRNDGDTAAALAAAARVVEARYSYPYLQHATLEPMNALAWPTGNGGIEIHAPTQTPSEARDLVAAVLNIPKHKVRVQFTRIGGGFGRRLVNDYVVEAAAICQRVGGPVKLTWTREQDTQHGYYRPLGWHRFTGGLDAAGNLIAWQDHFVTVGLNSAQRWGRAAYMSPGEFPGGFLPSFRLERSIINTNVPTSWLRAPGSNGLAFAIQGFIDELAHAAGRDPVEFRLALLGADREVAGAAPNDPPYSARRMKKVVMLAAEKSGWGSALPRGEGRGVAFHFSHRGYAAMVAHVAVAPDGALKVRRVTAAVDVGPIVNLSGAENQVQGSVIDGLSAAWQQEITVARGRVVQSNFDDYPLLRVDQAPAIDVHFIQSSNPPTGLGEPALPPLAPAVCNAIYIATGKRVRTLPLRRSSYEWN